MKRSLNLYFGYIPNMLNFRTIEYGTERKILKKTNSFRKRLNVVFRSDIGRLFIFHLNE